jgi:MIP family channel proteins
MADLTSPVALKAAFAEFIATALFVFFGVGSVAVAAAGGGIVAIALSFGLAIALLAAGAGPISGGHLNPAVTFAMMITNRISAVKGLMYIAAQLVGGILGALLLRVFIVEDVLAAIPGAGGLAVTEAMPSNLAAVGVEATITFALVWTVFATAVSPRGSGNLAPLYIGLAVVVIHLVAIPLTGTGANPARSLGPAVGLPGVTGDLPGRWEDQWIYWAGPLIGAALASLTYWLLYLQAEGQPAASPESSPVVSQS